MCEWSPIYYASSCLVARPMAGEGSSPAGGSSSPPPAGASLRHSPAPAPQRSVTRHSKPFTERILPFTAPERHMFFQISNVSRDGVKWFWWFVAILERELRTPGTGTLWLIVSFVIVAIDLFSYYYFLYYIVSSAKPRSVALHLFDFDLFSIYLINMCSYYILM